MFLTDVRLLARTGRASDMEHRHHVELTDAGQYRSVDPRASALRAIIEDLDASAGEKADGSYTSDGLANAARRICAAAHDDGLYIEQALVRVKDAWRSTPDRIKPRSGGNDPVLDQLVSACIREFYTER